MRHDQQTAAAWVAPAIQVISLDELVAKLERSCPNPNVLAMLEKARELQMLKKV